MFLNEARLQYYPRLICFMIHSQNKIMNNPNGRRYCFTLNNYSDAEQESLRQLAQDVKYLVFGREVGESGTPHLQGFVVFRTSTRFVAAKRAIGNRAHLELARGTSAQASLYCKKDDDYEEFGELETSPAGKTNRFADFKKWVLEQATKPTAAQVASEYPSIYLQYGRCMEWIDLIYPTPEPPTGVQLRDHQRRLEERLEDEADDRKIIFVCDPVGNTGKSFFAKYLMQKYPDSVQRLSIGKRDDLCYAIDEHKSIFLFDIPRSQSEYLQYSVLESLKDGHVFSTKYQSRSKVFNHKVHVVVFMNEQPDRNKLSADRYEVIHWLNL